MALDGRLAVVALFGVVVLIWAIYAIYWAKRQRSARSDVEPSDTSVTKTYKGRPGDAMAMYELDGAFRTYLSGLGFREVGRTYVPGSWSWAMVGLGVALIFLGGFGVLLLLYMALVQPLGSLVVTYER